MERSNQNRESRELILFQDEPGRGQSRECLRSRALPLTALSGLSDRVSPGRNRFATPGSDTTPAVPSKLGKKINVSLTATSAYANSAGRLNARCANARKAAVTKRGQGDFGLLPQ